MIQKKKQFIEYILDQFFSLFDRYPREYFIAAFFWFFFLSIISETFSYTVINRQFYTDLAYKQQVWEVEVPVARGTIYSSTGDESTVLATSVELNDLAIDPKVPWDKEELLRYLTGVVYKELCYLQSSEECYENLLKYLRVLEILDYEFDEIYIKSIIEKQLREKISQERVTSVLVTENMDAESAVIIGWLRFPWVYINGTNLYVNPEEITSESVVAKEFSRILWWNQKEYEFSIRKRELRYIPILNKISLLSSDEITQHIEEESQAIKQGILEEEDSIWGFMILTPHAQRIYPEWEVGAQVVWFLSNDGNGNYGIEGNFNDILKWAHEQLVSRKDIRGRTIDPLSSWDQEWRNQGADIYTSIDRNIQRKVEKYLEAGVKEYGANRGTAIVMDPYTGNIIAMANYPTFDPNSPWDVYEIEKVSYIEYPNPVTDLLGRAVFVEDIEKWDKYIYDGKEIYLREAERSEYGDFTKVKYKYKNDYGAGVYKNDAISSLYEPGSIMKAITVATWIDTGEMSPSDMYQDDMKVTIDNFTIKNASGKCAGYNSFAHALNYSCNVWMIRIVQRLGKALFYHYFQLFGFGEITGITLQWEVYSKLIPYEKWSRAQLFTSSYGLWVSVTPLQMVTAYSVIANGGVYVKPKIINSINYGDGKIVEYKPETSHRVIKESTAKTVSELLQDGVENGVAQNARVPWYSVAGKTGTAQIAYKWWYEVGTASTVGSFVGFWPVEDPKFVIVVKIERPRNSVFGWETSAFIFAKIAKDLFDYYGIPKKE